jgi:uncharacterized membrane protein YphA (DoxX/SURF4 family)
LTVRDNSQLGTGKKSALCAACGTCFTSVTGFVIHQNWTYTESGAELKCASTPEELAARNLVLGKRGRYTIDPESKWWESVREAIEMLNEDEEED